MRPEREVDPFFPAHSAQGGAVRGFRMAFDSPSIRGHCLSHSFGKGQVRSTALREVSIELDRGQITLLMGPSGSGKSTLLSILSGLLRPQSGKVIALDQDLW